MALTRRSPQRGVVAASATGAAASMLSGCGAFRGFSTTGGPKGLPHRFTRGFPLPSFTGGTVTSFRSPEAVEAWSHLQRLRENTVPTSTTYDFLREPPACGEASIGWDHLARPETELPQDPSS